MPEASPSEADHHELWNMLTICGYETHCQETGYPENGEKKDPEKKIKGMKKMQGEEEVS